MATTDALAHGDDHHDHPPFLAHHFETPEQQYDSGKLGMWLFLVTEVLFFSGLFCAYTIFRTTYPEVFAGCSVFLNTQLGAINTGVLLFSSLTMAWAVRCAQLEQHRLLTGMLAATIGCATIFLGVKAVEYAHKFGMGLLPAGYYNYDPAAPHDGTIYLVWISAPFAVAVLGTLVWYAVACLGRNRFQMKIAGPLLVSALCFFVGVGLGLILESGHSEGHDAAHAAEHVAAAEGDTALIAHADGGGRVSDADSEVAGTGDTAGGRRIPAAPIDPVEVDAEVDLLNEPTVQRIAQDANNTGVRDQISAQQRQQAVATGTVQSGGGQPALVTPSHADIHNKRQAGLFFSIYYCITGLHAIHITIGIGVLIWLLVRSVRQDFNRQYFGPVDGVGLYWHLVDLIWIYLFPLLYLIR